MPWLWGWPHKFQQRMQNAGVDVFVLGPYDGSFGTSGIDDLGQLAELPKDFTGGIWTNRIDRIGAAARGNAKAP
jgi:glycerophosphoryl diester phosphodiesterase